MEMNCPAKYSHAPAAPLHRKRMNFVQTAGLLESSNRAPIKSVVNGSRGKVSMNLGQSRRGVQTPTALPAIPLTVAFHPCKQPAFARVLSP
jgi:hypothetical protein